MERTIEAWRVKSHRRSPAKHAHKTPPYAAGSPRRTPNQQRTTEENASNYGFSLNTLKTIMFHAKKAKKCPKSLHPRRRVAGWQFLRCPRTTVLHSSQPPRAFLAASASVLCSRLRNQSSSPCWLRRPASRTLAFGLFDQGLGLAPFHPLSQVLLAQRRPHRAPHPRMRGASARASRSAVCVSSRPASRPAVLRSRRSTPPLLSSGPARP